MPVCPICSYEVSEDDYRKVYVFPYNGQEYKRYECPECDLHWWEPLKMVPEFYESEVFSNYAVFHKTVRLKLNRNHRVFFDYFPHQEVKGNILDIGCGDGVFLMYAKNFGYNVYGIDIDTKSVENIKSRLGIDTVYAMDLEEFVQFAKKENLKFDVITFFEVLEHQDNPKKFLKHVKCLLKPRGYIAGSVPNRESIFWRKLYQKNSYDDYPPHHFLRFSKLSLKKALEFNGFIDISVYRLDFELSGIFPVVEKEILGDLSSIRDKLKGKVVGDEVSARAVSVEDLGKVGDRKLLALTLRILKIARNILLFPFALPYLPKLKGNGTNLYFQARRG